MRVGVDACCWINARGYGRFIRELLRHMVVLAPEDEFVCFADPWTHEKLDLEGPNVRTRRVELSSAPAEAAAAEGYRSPLDLFRLTRAVWREKPDVFFSPSVYTYFPLPPGRPAVVAIHDAIAERYPEWTLPTRRARLFWRAKVRLAILQSRLILTVSHFARRELSEVLGIPADRIRVAEEAPAPAYRPSEDAAQIRAAAGRFDIPDGARWITYVGGFNPHKHVDAIARAHARVAHRHADSPLYLVLVGSITGDVFHGDQERIRKTIREAGAEELVRWTGFVEDDTLRHLHSGALALMLPSACEGFGLPAVEAAACATPVIATTQSPLPELLEGGGIFVTPGSAEPLVDALERLLADEAGRLAMGRRALERVSLLSWDKSARTALEALREARG